MKKIVHFFDKYSMLIYIINFIILFSNEILLGYFLLKLSTKVLFALYSMFIHLCIFMAYQLFEYKHKIGYFRNID